MDTQEYICETCGGNHPTDAHQDNLENRPEVSIDRLLSDTPESRPAEQKREFSVEIKGQKFDFLEIQSVESSDTLLIHLPGFGEDAEQYAEPMHVLMEKSYRTVALKRYGEVFSRELLVEALGQVIQSSGKQNTVFHGDSFGAAVVYDLISNPADREFLKRNNVVGAILEAPFLDKNHLKGKARLIPDEVLIRGSMLFDKVRNLRSLTPRQDMVELSPSEKKSIIREALREKKGERKIEVPIHVVFVEDESLSDNEKIMKTLQSQGQEVSSITVMSADDNRHHIADGQYEDMWREEKEAIDVFVKPV